MIRIGDQFCSLVFSLMIKKKETTRPFFKKAPDQNFKPKGPSIIRFNFKTIKLKYFEVKNDKVIWKEDDMINLLLPIVKITVFGQIMNSSLGKVNMVRKT